MSLLRRSGEPTGITVDRACPDTNSRGLDTCVSLPWLEVACLIGRDLSLRPPKLSTPETALGIRRRTGGDLGENTAEPSHFQAMISQLASCASLEIYPGPDLCDAKVSIKHTPVSDPRGRPSSSSASPPLRVPDRAVDANSKTKNQFMLHCSVGSLSKGGIPACFWGDEKWQKNVACTRGERGVWNVRRGRGLPGSHDITFWHWGWERSSSLQRGTMYTCVWFIRIFL